MSETPTVERISSVTQKTYTVALSGGEPREWPYSPQLDYRPRKLTVVKRNGNVASIELTGPQVKKDGNEGSRWARERFWSVDAVGTPAWVKSIVGGLA